MKGISLFCTKWYIFLTELPPVALLAFTLSMHEHGKPPLGYYPLEIFLGLVIIFIMVYFFRVVTVSTDEVRIYGLFSSRDRAYIKKDHTLIIHILPRSRVKIELRGSTAGMEKVYDWLKGDDEGRDVSLFREKANGNEKKAGKILKYFGLTAEEAREALDNEGYYLETDDVIVSTLTHNEVFQVRIFFKETIV